MLKAYAVALVLSVSTPVEKNDGAKQQQKQKSQESSTSIFRPRTIRI